MSVGKNGEEKTEGEVDLSRGSVPGCAGECKLKVKICSFFD